MGFRSRARAIGRSAASPKSTFVQAIGGGVSYYAHKLGSDNVEFIGKNFWAGPVIMGVLGHLLKRSGQLREVGAAMVGAAGYSLALGYAANQSAKANTQTAGIVDVGYTGGELPDNMANSFMAGTSGWLPEVSAYDEDYDVSEAMAIGRQ